MSDEKKKARPTQVAIFGAGIAGLTAAHELIERGYDVEVYESAEPSPMDKLQGAACAIGGMARTQWSRTRARFEDSPPLSSTEKIETIREAIPMPRLPKGYEDCEEDEVFSSLKPLAAGEQMRREGEVRPASAASQLEASTLDRLAENWPKDSWPVSEKLLRRWDGVLGRVATTISRLPDSEKVEIRGWCSLPRIPIMEAYEFPGPWKPWRWDLVFAQVVGSLLVNCYGVDKERLRVRAHGLGYRDDWVCPAHFRNRVTFGIFEEDWIPGEHGFRFFPAFYRNLFDTMRRIPIAEDRKAYVESGRSVLNNIEPTRVQGFRFKDPRRSFTFPRQPPSSLHQFFETTRSAFQSMQFKLSDIGRFELKLFQYMTSSSERRATEYENQSWWDFLGGDRFGEGFRHFLEETPQTLLAMRSTESDARTYGNIQVQMLLDQFGKREITDGTLNGPTSEAWFDHWRTYLESQGVRFRRGELIGFEVCEGRIWPKVSLPIEARHQGPERDDDVATVLTRDRYVVAIPAHEIQRLIRAHNTAAPSDERLTGGDFDRILALDLGDPTQPIPGGEMAHMSGIQFYFDRDVPLLPGHTAYSDAEWGLSSISQPQFWTRRRGWWDGYRGLLSVDICTWHVPGYKKKEIAWNCTRDEIAQEIWDQIAATSLPGEHMPTPTLYHFDENIELGTEGPRARKPLCNKTPFMISRVGVYPTRPGCLVPGDPERGYDAHFGSLVFAGTYMQTFTRMTTMEAANESGRHAVNGLLRVEGSKGPRCSVANPEEHEIDDLRPYIDLDRELHKLGLPHFIEILGLDELPPRLLERDSGASDVAAAVLRLSR